MRSPDRLLRHDEWPNLSSLDTPGARFPDGEPVTPLAPPEAPPWQRLRFIVGVAFLLVSVAFRGCGG